MKCQLQVILLLAATASACADAPASDRALVLAATTTIEDSGLLDTLVAAYGRQQARIRVVPVTAGSGAVLEMGRRGDVDVMLTHDPGGEERFVSEGYGVERNEFMHNGFIIAGPAADPAGIRGMAGAVAALARIAVVGAPFVSRGDDSGTHRKERRLWARAGLDPWTEAGDWYVEAGVGMGEALRLADERDAYILSEPATYRALRHVLELEALVAGDPVLVNRYGVVIPVEARNAAAARKFKRWLLGPEGARVIDAFRIDAGTPPFHSGPAPGG